MHKKLTKGRGRGEGGGGRGEGESGGRRRGEGVCLFDTMDIDNVNQLLPSTSLRPSGMKIGNNE